MTSVAENHPSIHQGAEIDYCPNAIALSHLQLAAAIVRTEARLETLRAELRRRNISTEYIDQQRTIDREFDQRLADDASQPGIDYME